jgi:membrane-associated phospholipid phosphatase
MVRISLFFLLFNLLFVSFPQSNLERSFSSLGDAASQSFSWVDIPALGLVLSSTYFPLRLKNKLDFERFSFDEEFQESFYVPGSHSLGSTDPRRFPETVFMGRLAFTTAAGLLFGMDTRESYKHTFVFMKAVLYNFALTELIKNLTHRDRPDLSDNRSFFSGHTSSTFVTSTFLYQEVSSLLDASVANSTLRTTLKTTSFVALYGWAGYVGYSRMRDNKHYFSDVLIGAAVGTGIGLFFHNLYFDEEEAGILDNLSLGVRDNQPVLNFHMSLN